MNKDKSQKLYMWLIVILVAISMVIAVVFIVRSSGSSGEVITNYTLWLDYTSINNPDESVLQRYSLKVNAQGLADQGYDGSQMAILVNRILRSFDTFYEATFDKRIEELRVELKAKGYTDQEISNYLMGNECNVGWDIVNQEIVAQRHFSDRQHYNDYYMIDDSSNDNVDYEKGFFYNRQVTRSHNVFYNDLLSPYSYFGDTIDGNPMQIFWGVKDGVVLTQTFVTISDFKSNASSTDEDQGWHFYQWNVKDFDDMVELYYLIPVTGNWYMIALIVVIVLAAIIYMAGVNRVGVSTKKGYIFKKKKKFIWIDKDEL